MTKVWSPLVPCGLSYQYVTHFMNENRTTMQTNCVDTTNDS